MTVLHICSLLQNSSCNNLRLASLPVGTSWDLKFLSDIFIDLSIFLGKFHFTYWRIQLSRCSLACMPPVRRWWWSRESRILHKSPSCSSAGWSLGCGCRIVSQWEWAESGGKTWRATAAGMRTEEAHVWLGACVYVCRCVSWTTCTNWRWASLHSCRRTWVACRLCCLCPALNPIWSIRHMTPNHWGLWQISLCGQASQ